MNIQQLTDSEFKVELEDFTYTLEVTSGESGPVDYDIKKLEALLAQDVITFHPDAADYSVSLNDDNYDFDADDCAYDEHYDLASEHAWKTAVKNELVQAAIRAEITTLIELEKDAIMNNAE